MFCSAMPRLKNRSGCRWAKSIVRLAFARSAVRTTMRGSVSAKSASSSPATNAGVELAGMPLVVFGSLRASGPAFPLNRPLSVDSAIAASLDQRLEAPAQLGHDVVVVSADEPADVPLDVAFHPFDAATLDRVGDDHLRR